MGYATMKWIKRHINITWTLFALLWFSSGYLNNETLTFIMFAVLIGITLFSLYLKKRSYAWILIPISVLFLQNQEQILKENEWKKLKLNSLNHQ